MVLSELRTVLEKIEELRKEMDDLAKTKGFLNPEVIKASHRLDAALNEYEKLLQKKKEK